MWSAGVRRRDKRVHGAESHRREMESNFARVWEHEKEQPKDIFIGSEYIE